MFSYFIEHTKRVGFNSKKLKFIPSELLLDLHANIQVLQKRIYFDSDKSI